MKIELSIMRPFLVSVGHHIYYKIDNVTY